MKELTTSMRLWLGTVVICCILYTALILLIGQVFVPEKANGSLMVVGGQVVGSRQIAQAFTRPEYIWPRPSAVDYDAAATGGSNLSPTNELLNERARSILEALDLPSGTNVPADLVAASGSGMDPHITLEAALLQAPRVAQARGVSLAQAEAFIEEQAFYPSGIPSGGRIVTVLPLNIALDERYPVPEDASSAMPDITSPASTSDDAMAP